MALQRRRRYVAEVFVSVGVGPQTMTPPRARSPIVVDAPRDFRMALVDETTVIDSGLF